jgi:hypothetical protein
MLIGFLTLLAIIAIDSTIAMIIWNLIIPEIFHLKTISIFEAIGLTILSNILFCKVVGKSFEKKT